MGYCPIIFVQTTLEYCMFSRAKDTEPFGYLTKPYRTCDLNAVVTLALQPTL